MVQKTKEITTCPKRCLWTSFLAPSYCKTNRGAAFGRPPSGLLLKKRPEIMFVTVLDNFWMFLEPCGKASGRFLEYFSVLQTLVGSANHKPRGAKV